VINLQRRVGIVYVLFFLTCLGIYSIEKSFPFHYWAIISVSLVLFGVTAFVESTPCKIIQVAGLVMLSFFCFFWNNGDGYFGMGALIISFLLCAAYGFFEAHAIMKFAIFIIFSVLCNIFSFGPSLIHWGWAVFNVIFCITLWAIYKALVARYREKEYEVISALMKIIKEYEKLNGSCKEALEEIIRRHHYE